MNKKLSMTEILLMNPMVAPCWTFYVEDKKQRNILLTKNINLPHKQNMT